MDVYEELKFLGKFTKKKLGGGGEGGGGGSRGGQVGGQGGCERNVGVGGDSSFYLKYFLRYGIYKISFRFFQRAVILQGEIIPKKNNTCLLFFHEESIHEVSRRYLIPEYHRCKISGSKILKKGNNSKNII